MLSNAILTVWIRIAWIVNTEINQHQRKKRKGKKMSIMNNATQRSILRWVHIIFAIPIIGYIYSPFEQLPNYAPATRFVFVPVIVLSGLWMWKGHVLRRLISKSSARQDAAATSTAWVHQQEISQH